MSLRNVIAGSVDESTVLRIVDTGGIPASGLVFNSAGIDLWYRRDGAAKTSITEATLANAGVAHSDGGFVEIGHGYYRLDAPDAAWAAGVKGVLFGGTITNYVVIGSYHQLVSAGDDGAFTLLLLPDGTALAMLPAGQSVYYRLFDNAGLAWDFTAKQLVAIGSTSNDYIAATERTTIGGVGHSGYTATLPISDLQSAGAAKSFTLLVFFGGSPADTDPTVLPPLAFAVQFGRLGEHPLTVQTDVSVKSTAGTTAQLKIWLDRDNERMPVSTAGGTIFTADAGTDVCTSTAHGLSNGDALRLTTSNTLPAGLSAGTTYFVINATTDTFKLSATSGGSAINITSTGTGTHKWLKPTARLRLREHGAGTGTLLFDQTFTAEHLKGDVFEVELANPNFTTDRQYDAQADVIENGTTHTSYHPHVVM